MSLFVIKFINKFLDVFHRPLIDITKEQAIKREKASFIAREEALLRGPPPGTLQEGRDLFEALAKTYSPRWNRGNIEDQKLGVTIKPPFRAHDVTGKEPRSVKYVQELINKLNNK